MAYATVIREAWNKLMGHQHQVVPIAKLANHLWHLQHALILAGDTSYLQQNRSFKETRSIEDEKKSFQKKSLNFL